MSTLLVFLVLLLSSGLCTFCLIEVFLAQTHAFWSNFKVFVPCHSLKSALDSHRVGGFQEDSFVSSRGTHVRKLLSFSRIHGHIVTFDCVTNNHSFVDFSTRLHIERAAFLQVAKRKA